MLDVTSLPLVRLAPKYRLLRYAMIAFRYQLPDLRETGIICDRMRPPPPPPVRRAKVRYITGLRIK